MVSVSPVIAYAFVAINDQGIHSQHLQPRCWSKTSLTSTWK
jgi:hypothetical protein